MEHRKSKKNKHSLDEYKGRSNFFNKYFSKIFIINLKDFTKRFEKTTKQFHTKGIKYTRFDAIDGRCKNEDPKIEKKCIRLKKKQFEKEYNVSINMDSIPAASLTIGTILILRLMIKNKWPRILICEDDVELNSNILSRFEKVVKNELKNIDYDLLYLGCGNQCGFKGISETKTKENKHLTSMSIIKSQNYDWYVKYKNDIRMPCDECVELSKNLTQSPEPYGTWAYAITLSGAKKLLKYIDNNCYAAIDMILVDAISDDILKAVAFDPPLVMHEDGAFRPDSAIDWEW